jgi:hypothetical protein
MDPMVKKTKEIRYLNGLLFPIFVLEKEVQ